MSDIAELPAPRGTGSTWPFRRSVLARSVMESQGHSPPFDWHLTNLRNYVNQTAMDVPALAINGRTIAPLGEGTGMLGLSGDYTCFRSVSELGTSPAYTVLTYDDAVQRRIALADIDLTGGPARTHPVMPQPPVPTVF